jgi:hypothetical protein
MLTICRELELANDLMLYTYVDIDKSKYSWKYINEGIYRAAYLGEDGNVYKIPTEVTPEYIGENRREYSNYLRIKELPVFNWKGNDWLIPESMQLFEFPEYDYVIEGRHEYGLSVIVVPFINGNALNECIDECGASEIYECLEVDQAGTHYELYDVSCENVKVQPNGSRIIIDLQC